MNKTIQRTLFEMSARLVITLSVMIVFGERSSSKILYIFYVTLIIWALVIPVKDLITSHNHGNRKREVKDVRKS